MNTAEFLARIERAISQRASLFDAQHESAYRLFNGYSEGCPDLVIDVYARTLLIFANARTAPLVDNALDLIRKKLDWLRSAILKQRESERTEDKHGRIIWGDQVDSEITEQGVSYSLDLLRNHDAGFFLDTRNLRRWLIDKCAGKTVLNTFAYTGSLGVAAQAGRAAHVTQFDRNKSNLQFAKSAYALNGFDAKKLKLLALDFFPAVAQFKGSKQLFDIVILDPPFFSSTSKGRVQAQDDGGRLINKLRPLVADRGSLIAVNNALFVSGREYMQTLERLCADGYLSIHELIPVSDDVVGYERANPPVTDPAPFNHSTKIAVLAVKRKTS